MTHRFTSAFLFISLVLSCFSSRLSAVNYTISGPTVAIVNANISGVDFFYDFTVTSDDNTTPRGSWISTSDGMLVSGSLTGTSCKLRWTTCGIKTITFGPTSFSIAVIDQSTVTYSYDLAGNRISRSIVLRTKSAIETDSVPATPAQSNPIFDTLTLNPQLQTIAYNDTTSLTARIRAYPNPTKNIVLLDVRCRAEYAAPASVLVFDCNGVIVLQKDVTISNDQIAIDFSAIAAGQYFMVLRSNTTTKSWTISKIN